MTSLAIALAVDARAPAALYIISDSRIIFQARGRITGTWDAGQKTFASSFSADIFGFVGDGFFPPAILRQLVDQMNAGLLFEKDASAEMRHTRIERAFRRVINRQAGQIPIVDFAIFHGARDAESMQSNFRLWETRYDAAKKSWTSKEHDLASDQSYFAHVDGTGAKYVVQRGKEWHDTDANGTSRAAMWSFCNAMREARDPYSGGPPQLVGLWRKGEGQTFGFRWNGKGYISGAEAPKSAELNSIAWFNHRFERCDGLTGRRLKEAARHPKPKRRT